MRPPALKMYCYQVPGESGMLSTVWVATSVGPEGHSGIARTGFAYVLAGVHHGLTLTRDRPPRFAIEVGQWNPGERRDQIRPVGARPPPTSRVETPALLTREIFRHCAPREKWLRLFTSGRWQASLHL